MVSFLDSHGSQVFRDMMAEVQVNVEAKGWRETRNSFAEYIALLHSEVSEALEAYRDHHDVLPHYRMVNGAAPDGLYNLQVKKPIGVDSELADVLIRLLDMCELYEIDLFKAYQDKMAYNRTRPYQHGGRTLESAPKGREA